MEEKKAGKMSLEMSPDLGAILRPYMTNPAKTTHIYVPQKRV